MGLRPGERLECVVGLAGLLLLRAHEYHFSAGLQPRSLFRSAWVVLRIFLGRAGPSNHTGLP